MHWKREQLKLMQGFLIAQLLQIEGTISGIENKMVTSSVFRIYN